MHLHYAMQVHCNRNSREQSAGPQTERLSYVQFTVALIRLSWPI